MANGSRASSRKKGLDHVWQSRYDDINAFEKTLARGEHAGSQVLSERLARGAAGAISQRGWTTRRRIGSSRSADLKERAHWDEYQQAYEDMLNATSTEAAPWYVIPADKKWFTRACVADIITTRLRELDLKYPTVPEKEAAALAEAKRELEAEQD